jgi:hypothetical protein
MGDLDRLHIYHDTGACLVPYDSSKDYELSMSDGLSTSSDAERGSTRAEAATPNGTNQRRAAPEIRTVTGGRGADILGGVFLVLIPFGALAMLALMAHAAWPPIVWFFTTLAGSAALRRRYRALALGLVIGMSIVAAMALLVFGVLGYFFSILPRGSD